MKRPSLGSSPKNSAKRLKLHPDSEVEESNTYDSASGADILRYESYEQFKKLIEDPSFTQRVRLPQNKDIIHRIVTDSLNLTEEDINERKKILDEIIRKQRALLNYRTPGEKYTALHQPNVHLELIKHLVARMQQKAYSTTATDRLTFVHLLANRLNPDEFHELVTFLLEMDLGELVTLGDCNGSTPMHVAVLNIEVKEATILMCRSSEDIQFDLNAVDDAGNNIFSYAVMGGRKEEYLNLLLRLGAVPMADSYGYNVIHHAATSGNVGAIELFGSVDNITHEAYGGVTPLHVALSSGKQNIHDVVQALVGKCKDAVLLQDDEGQTPLWLAKNGPIKERIEPRTVDLLQKCLGEIKYQFKEDGRSATINAEDIKPSTTKHQAQAEVSSTGNSGNGDLSPDDSDEESIISVESGSTSTVYSDDAIHRVVSNSLACLDGDVEFLKTEIKAILKSNPGLINSKVEDDEKTPLLCENVHVELLKFLISKGADVSVTTKYEETVLHLAARYLLPETYQEVVLLVKGRNPEVLKAVDPVGVLAVMVAVHEMEVKEITLEAFLEAGADLTALDHFGGNLLNYAIQGGRTVDFMKTLTTLGIKPVRTNDGRTLIHFAAQHGTLDVLRYVIGLLPSEDINRLDQDQQSPLHYACKTLMTDEALNKVHALLNDYGVKDHLGKRPMRNLIHDIVSLSDDSDAKSVEIKKQIIDELLECDHTLLDEEEPEDKRTALEEAFVHVELIKYLITKGCDPRHRFSFAELDHWADYSFLHMNYSGNFSPQQYHELLEFLIANGYRDILEMRDAHGRRPLHEAVRTIELKGETLELFKTHGGGLNHEDNGGWNILFYAADGGRSLDCVKMLLDKAELGKDDIDVNGKRETSAAHIAARKGNMELLKFFLELNPKLAYQKNTAGETPLHLAIKNVKKEEQLQLLDILSLHFQVKNDLKLEPVQELMRVCAEDARGKSSEEIEKRVKIMEAFFPPTPPCQRVAPIRRNRIRVLIRL